MYLDMSTVNVVFGSYKSHRIEEIARGAGFSRGVLICDKFFEQNGVAEDLLKCTPSLVDVFSDVTANPLLSSATSAAELIVSTHADYVVALGGGSSLDLGKFASALAVSDGTAQDYFWKRRTFEASLPLFTVPTTAGTGSEVTGVAVMTDDVTGEKAPVNSPCFYAHTAIVDPDLTMSVPPFVTAATGLDAMAHALEAYWCNAHNPVSDKNALSALKRLFENLEQAYLDGSNARARAQMSLGALEAGLAFAPTRTAAVHACSYPLSDAFHICHGEACAMTLDAFLLFNAGSESVRLNALCYDLGFEDIDAMAAEIRRLKKLTGMHTSLSQFGTANCDELAKACLAHPLMKNNPEIPTLAQMSAILEHLE